MMLPLLQYHKDQHMVADPLIADIFYAESHAAAATELDERLERITIINLETRLFNKLNNIEADTGVIDIDIFLYAWREASLGPYLRDFCRLHHYPIEWARQPPETGYTYQPYEHHYWEADDWATPTLLLGFIWQLRKERIELEIVEDHEVILLEFEFSLNRRVRHLHSLHGNAESEIGFLRTESLLQAYSTLGYHLRMADQDQYEECRENLRKECALYGYSNLWVPGPYLQEVASIRYPVRG